MKEGVIMSNHLNEFNSNFDKLSGHVIDFNTLLKAVFLLINLPESSDTFCTTLTNTTTTNGLSSTMIESNLLTKEVN